MASSSSATTCRSTSRVRSSRYRKRRGQPQQRADAAAGKGPWSTADTRSTRASTDLAEARVEAAVTGKPDERPRTLAASEHYGQSVVFFVVWLVASIGAA